ncbi:CotH kinase family protein [Tautonia plasticadhaerens]|uniref:CotH protein n=1 Tax=Tautonia plasticadhaerens TaxID=2527974 RepID=A0A518HDI9_9BACT|nr:CotH kinase family protein [Tautonia plasticadhaerens]QDV38925.1 CotH protein [Tautonia plasticadhaerens]
MDSASGPIISELLASNAEGLRDQDGDRSDWVEIHNPTASAVDLVGWSLTDDEAEPGKWAFPGVVLPPGGFLVVFASDKDRADPAGELHANFKLGAEGEYLGLVRPDGVVADAYAPGFPEQEADRSFGVAFGPGGAVASPLDRRAFALPTPGGPNREGEPGAVEPVVAGVPRGFYDAPFLLTLGSATEGAEIRFTIDGSTPTAEHGFIYAGPLVVDRTMVVRAAAFKEGDSPAPPGAWTYLFLDDVLRQSPDGRAPLGWPETWGAHVVDYGMDPRIVNHPRFGGERLKAALRSIPTISLSTDLPNLFDPASGIYANSTQEGREWERPVSAELINPDGSTGFQINAGLRLRGTSSGVITNPKHSLRLFFRSEYGAPRLEYPLFGPEGADSFARVDLRTDQSISWGFKGNPNATFATEVFARDTMRDLGQPYTRSRYYHLYINGQYWGLYQSEERPDANFGATYFGGDPDDFDVIRPENGAMIGATDGDLGAWSRLWQAATAPGGLASDGAYYRIQGRNPDGSPNPEFENLVDVDSLIDYMLTTLYIGNIDGPISRFNGQFAINNFYVIRDRTGDDGFRFLMRDAEFSLLRPTENVNGPVPIGSEFATFNPQYLHQQLLANPTYRQKFADRVDQTFFGDGPLTPRASIARFRARADAIGPAILGESARWGDAQRPRAPLTEQDWRRAVGRVVRGYLPVRTRVVLNQFRALGLLPGPRPPRFPRA